MRRLLREAAARVKAAWRVLRHGPGMFLQSFVWIPSGEVDGRQLKVQVVRPTDVVDYVSWDTRGGE